jgi:hypothetical protein
MSIPLPLPGAGPTAKVYAKSSTRKPGLRKNFHFRDAAVRRGFRHAEAVRRPLQIAGRVAVARKYPDGAGQKYREGKREA